MDYLNETYLPLARHKLNEHFAPVVGGATEQHLTYYRNSVAAVAKYRAALVSYDGALLSLSRNKGRLKAEDPALLARKKVLLAAKKDKMHDLQVLGNQMEKDERFWSPPP